MSMLEDTSAEDTVEPNDELAPSLLQSGHDRALGLRGKLEYYYRELKRLQREMAAQSDEAGRAREAFYLEMIQVADSFETVFRMFEDSRKLKKQRDALECFRTTYHVLIEALEAEGIHQVPVLGKTYDGVDYEGVAIPEPWTVVGVEEKDGKRGNKHAKKVLQGLWVAVSDRRLKVLRRAQVMC